MQLGYHGILEKYDEEIEGLKKESFQLGIFKSEYFVYTVYVFN